GRASGREGSWKNSSSWTLREWKCRKGRGENTAAIRHITAVDKHDPIMARGRPASPLRPCRPFARRGRVQWSAPRDSTVERSHRARLHTEPWARSAEWLAFGAAYKRPLP